MNKTNLNTKMNKKIKNNAIIICTVMIFIHVLGLIYQIVYNLATLSILLKELFIVIFIVQIALIKFEIKYTKYICYGLNLAIIVISGIYMDFSSVIISILLMLYISNLYDTFYLSNDVKNNLHTSKNNSHNTNEKSKSKEK